MLRIATPDEGRDNGRLGVITLRLYGSGQSPNLQGRIPITPAARRRVQSQIFAKTSAGVLGAVVAATAAVTFGSAGIAQACEDNNTTAPFTSCVYVQNNTGYTVYSSGGNLGAQTIGDGTTFSDAVPMGDEFSFTFTMPENANYAASTWTLTYDYETGSFPATAGWASGRASSPASFGTHTTTNESLTLGGATHSFTGRGPSTCGNCVAGAVAPVRVNYASETPSNTRGTVIVVNEKPMKIWGPRTNPSQGVAAKPIAPVSVVAAVSPVSSTLPAQTQSAAKTGTPHRAVSSRAAVTASKSAPFA